MPDLHPILVKLGLLQYFDKLGEEGFETWEAVLDITESDLDALGVKLGHRRLLQREIALTRGVPLEQHIASSQSGASEQSRGGEDSKSNGKGGPGTGAKRKYRRHPKNDENAPERPPSAYVIFSNRIREELKPQNLSFTAIAKKVGERWQDLPADLKEPYESEASSAKERYHAEMAEYKTTKSYREYQQYLAEFRAKNASNPDDKRPKLVQDESITSSVSAGSHPTDTADCSSGNTAFRTRRVDSTSSGGPQSATSGLSSPASNMSGPSALRTDIPSTVALSSASPTALSPLTSSTRRLPFSKTQTQAGTYTEAYSEKLSPNPGHHLLSDDRESQQSMSNASLSGSLDTRLSQSQTSPLGFARPPGVVQSTSPHTASDSSSKSSAASTWSANSTASSSIFPLAALDEPKKTGLSLPPLTAVSRSSYGRSLAYTDPVAARQSVEPLASRTASSKRAQHSSQSSSASSSKGMKFESLQLPLPYNISFGQRPLPRPEHETKLANIFDLQDIPGERKSLKDLTLQQEHAVSPSPAAPQGPPEPRYPPHVPRLPSLHSQARDDVHENGLHPYADPLSVLAYAGRLVGRETRRLS